MASCKGGGRGGYDDDWDDGGDDDDYSDDGDYGGGAYDDYDDAPAQVPKKAAPKAAKPASAMAKALAPKPRAGGGQAAAAAAAVRAQKFPLAPALASAAAAGGGAAFAFDAPSPDDVALAAQAKSSLHISGAAAAAPPAAAAAPHQPPPPPRRQGPPAAAAAAPPCSAPPPPRRPVSEYAPDAETAAACAAAEAAEAAAAAAGGHKPGLHLVVVGHVDAGKSTLMGRLLAATGVVPERAVHRAARDAAAAGKASFGWAWLLDERPEERARGVTVDVATARFETARRAVTLLDAPGHRDFVPNMISGAAQADAALLVVDGAPGGFEAGFSPAPAPGAPGGGGGGAAPPGGGQTREHAQLARSLGVSRLAVVVTKLDVVGPAAAEARFAEVRAALEPFLAACGFRPADVQWLPAVGPSGDNLVAPPPAGSPLAWWRGPTLAAAIDAFPPAARLLAHPLRLPVADVLAAPSRGGGAAGGGVAVAGKLEAGALRPGMRVAVLPGGEVATVRALDVGGRPAALARAGDGAELVLTGLTEAGAAALRPGAVLCHPDFPVPLAARLEARVVALDGAAPLLAGAPVAVHAHAAREAGTLARLVALVDGRTGEVVRPRPRVLLAGQAALVEVAPGRPLPVEPYGGGCRALGRITLRVGSRTAAVGVVTAVLQEAGGGG